MAPPAPFLACLGASLPLMLSGYFGIPALGLAQSVPEEGIPGFCSHFIVFQFLSIYGKRNWFSILGGDMKFPF